MTHSGYLIKKKVRPPVYSQRENLTLVYKTGSENLNAHAPSRFPIAGVKDAVDDEN